MALGVDDVDLVRDRALVERFQEGDDAAFEVLYRRYFPRLKRFCQKRVGDADEAEEIAQEAFTRALGALPSFEGERRFYPWMTVIAARLCVDAHRRRGRSHPTAEVDLGVTDGGQDRIVEAADGTVLATALSRLAPRHREVLDLRERRSWSYQQIATHYGVTLGTVEALLFRARRALRREFLALNGDDRRWVTVPVLGLLARPMASLRARLEVWSAALPPLAGPALSVAVAVVATATATAGPGDQPFDRRDQPRRAPLHLEAVLPAAPSPAAPVGAATGPTDGARTPDAAPDTTGPERAAPEEDLLVITSAEEAERRGAESPHSLEVDGVVGVYVDDPADIASEAPGFAEGLARRGTR
ncbi:MAG: RNA polymerase sigma factor [Actinobacteria bacterium]|nr:RNA polymerase sigma factor [Actinomycetota bacterium]